LDKRRDVYASTGIRITDDPRGIAAASAVAALNYAAERYWKNLSAGRHDNWGRCIEEAQAVGQKNGLFSQLSNELFNTSPPSELLERLKAAHSLLDQTHKITTSARPLAVVSDGLRLSELVNWYQDFQVAELQRKSPNQLQAWREPRDRIIKEFITVIGIDRPVKALERADARRLFEHYLKRVKERQLTAATVNAYMIRIRTMVQAYYKYDGIKDKKPFDDLTMPGGSEVKRPPFPTSFIQDELLRTGALDRLNLQARCILYVMVETGLRPSEICGLRSNDIVIDAPVPKVSINDASRALKTANARREIPLVGVALMALTQFPDGFPRYLDRSTGLSEVVNTFLKTNKLLPTPSHSLYSLRHSFKDRLRGILAPPGMMDELMGHAEAGVPYGEGYPLEVKQSFLKRIMLVAPTRL
jgi:integrase